MAPATFKAAAFSAYGDSSKLEIVELPFPVPAANEVVIKVHAASLNPIDWKRAGGQLKMFIADSFPLRTGYDVSGTVESVGSAVTNFTVGQEVYSRIDERAGTVAEYVATAQENIALKPAALSHEEAAGVPLAALTAYQPFKLSGFKDRESRKFFVPAGAGGVGMFAIQFAKHAFNATEIATTVSEAKISTVKDLGATTVVDYKKSDFAKELKDYDAALDTTGEARKIFGILKPGASVYSIAAVPSGDYIASVFPQTGFLLKQGLNLASAPARWAASRSKVDYHSFFMKPSGADLAEIGKLADAGKLKVLIDSTHPFTLEGVKAAFDKSKSGRATGKIIIKVI
ncbi:NADPh quinone reductase [Geranomyces variabilis]|uniref:NADPh quinone reductase n=1 Tax=Geranomyces variabilis TaxID=109894 RepID=A0AAD5TUU3_9FUNG|nr:NADPh quinone reductase [Geranomyces variabilis]